MYRRFNTLNYKIGTNEVIADMKVGDVNGDFVKDIVCLVGEKEADSVFIDNLRLVIQCGKTGKYYIYPLEFSGGYDPKLFLGDFNMDKVKDIFIRIPTGGSGGYVYNYLFSFRFNNLRPLFNPEVINQGIKFSVEYDDCYKVNLYQNELNRRYSLDISNKPEDYLDEIYNDDGTLKEPIEGSANGLSGLFPIEYDFDNNFELFGVQRIVGIANADTLGYVNSYWKYYNNKLNLERIEMASGIYRELE